MLAVLVVLVVVPVQLVHRVSSWCSRGPIVINTNGTINVSGARDINLGTVSGTKTLLLTQALLTGKLTVTAKPATIALPVVPQLTL